MVSVEFSDVVEEWEQDSEVTEAALARRLRDLPRLHKKYMDWLVEYRARSRDLRDEAELVKFDRRRYWLGMAEERPAEKVNKTDVMTYVNVDPEYVRARRRTESSEEVVRYLERVLEVLRSQSFDVRALMDYEKFRAGQ